MDKFEMMKNFLKNYRKNIDEIPLSDNSVKNGMLIAIDVIQAYVDIIERIFEDDI